MDQTFSGKKCIIVEKRNHIGGNSYTYEQSGIQVHRYGAHIFHTSRKNIWDYVNQFAEFNHFINSSVTVYQDQIYNLPFHMNTFSRMWGIQTPAEAQAKIQEQVESLHITEPKNLEEHVLSLVGRDVYEKLVKGYTEKQWGRDCKKLPAFIIKRLPVRFVYDNNYFNDRYQGIPIGGYTQIVEKLLEGSDVLLETDYFQFVKENPGIAKYTLFTGMIDEFHQYRFSALAYRSLRFEKEELPIQNYQGCAVVNYTEREIPYTRIIKHKYFEFGTQPTTIITREYPTEWRNGAEPYYPVNDAANNALYQKYATLAKQEKNIIFGGRLAQYQYYDMDKVIAASLELVKNQL